METWNISKKLKIELLKKSSNIEDNSRRILFILRNLGPQRFTNLVKYSNLSRSTVSKYLSLHRKNKNIEQRLITDKVTNKQYRSYIITDRGIEKLGETPLKLKDEIGKILTPEQKEALKTMRQERFKDRREAIRQGTRSGRMQRPPSNRQRIKENF